METIRVNMTPCEDIKTIHASQNDNEGREWGFELHNNGEKIDSSSISDQLVFKAYEGGTEEILPTSGSTPTTSPFIGDIRYPQGLLTDQEFTYRESPTESDGLAFVESIKGNTLNWNQLVENGDFSASSGWTGQFATVTISNGVASVSQDRVGDYVALRKSNLQGLTGHKYLVVADVKSAKKTAIAFYLSNSFSSAYDIQANTRTVVHAIITVSNANTGGFNVYTNRKVELAEGDVVEFYHVMLFDLTQMGLDISANEFTSLFPLPYYDYNAGSLLSFNGTGLKTTGKNLVSESIWEQGSFSGSTGEKTTALSRIRFEHKVRLFANKTYSFSMASNYRIYIYRYDLSGNFLGYYPNGWSNPLVYTPTQDELLNVCMKYADDSLINPSNASSADFQMEISSAPTSYEPYTSSTLSLPISTYFPNGMNGIGNVFDEKTENKTIQRLVYYKVTGNENVYTWVDNTSTIYGNHYGGAIDIPSLRNCMYGGNMVAIASRGYQIKYANENKTIYLGNNGRLSIIDDSYTTRSAWLEGIKDLEVVFALRAENYVETSFTTASLVTENAEIPLSNNDGILIGKCTEELSAQPGFFDAKIKLADGDGTCYSDKIQLHVERKPS